MYFFTISLSILYFVFQSFSFTFFIYFPLFTRASAGFFASSGIIQMVPAL